MKKHFIRTLLSVMMVITFCLSPSFSAGSEPQAKFAPLSQSYLEWEAKHNSVPNSKSGPDTEGEFNDGYIPFPVDLSHLSANPPEETYNPFPNLRAPVTYDLRDYKFVPSVKNQNPYDTCWAFASIGAMESNAMKQGIGTFDLSEMHLAYYAFINPTKTKAFYNISSFSGAMSHGGNSFMPTALYTRLDGPVLETSVPYGKDKVPGYQKPEDYQRVLRLKEVYYIGMNSSNSEINKNVIKSRIQENGAVVASYCHSDSGYNTTANGTAMYTTSKSTNHAVQIVGWDDNFSKDNFKTKPSSNGAWLIKNSWGTSWGDSGYFWMSYESYMTDGTAFVVEQINPDLKVYYYDALGMTSLWGYTTSTYAANAFQATRDGEKLREVGLYTPDNNVKVTVKIYTDQGTSMPSTPLAGTLAKTVEQTFPYAGYHTITVSDPVSLTKGQYFSLVVDYGGQGMIPVETKGGMAANVAIENGSFFSYNGTSWVTGSSVSSNATIKAFTTSSAGETAPSITTSSLPAGTLNTSYSAVLSAYGATPITWTVDSGSLPAGLTLSSSGILSGIPTTEGNYTFTVKASNSKGNTTKQYTVTVSDLPTISTTAFTGYAGYALNAQLSLNANVSAKWSATNLPKGLKLKEDTGLISGKPSKAGSYSATVTAETSAGSTTDTVSFTIYDKPVKPAMKDSFPQINIGDTINKTITLTGTTPINIDVSADTLPAGLAYSVDSDSGKIYFSGTPTEAGTFQIVITMSNVVNDLTNKKADTKKLKLVIKAKPPVIEVPSSLPQGVLNEEYSGYQCALSEGTPPEKWSASGLPKGLTINAKTGYISGTPTKEGTFNVTISAQNNGGKDKTDKIPLVVATEPVITLKNLKAGTTGKAYSVKLTATGSPTSWSVALLPYGLVQSTDKNGAPIIAGTPTIPGEYDVVITASNSQGSDTKTLKLVIKGVAPKIKATLPKGTVGTAYSGTITVDGTKPLELTCEADSDSLEKCGLDSLEELGLTFTKDASKGLITIAGTPLYSVKNLSITVTASNAEKKNVQKKLKLTIAGTKPMITTPSSAVTQTLSPGIAVNISFVCTGAEKLTWSMKDLSGFTLTQDASDPHKATLAGTAPSSGKVSTTVTVTNNDGKASLKVTINAGNAGASALSLEDKSAPEADDDADDETEDTSKPALTFGAERSVSELGRTEQEAVAHGGYTIVAVLPELKAEADGMYDLDAALDENAPIGRTLVWLAFPQNAEASEDDEIAEFSDETGEETLTVPESRHVRVSVWLREGVTYAPVIAVK